MADTTRSFIAIEISHKMREELECLQQKLEAANADVKWVKPENIHLTLKFLGNVEKDKLQQIKSLLEKIASEFKPYYIHISETGAFPSPSYPRVVWVGINEGVDETKEIYKMIEDKLSHIGFEKEKRPFASHLTLGRVRSGKNKKALAELIEKEKEFKSSGRALIERIILLKSTLTPKGPIYEPIAQGTLTKT